MKKPNKIQLFTLFIAIISLACSIVVSNTISENMEKMEKIQKSRILNK